MAVDNTPAPEHVDDPKTDIGTEELADLTQEAADEVTKELTETQRVDDDKSTNTQIDDKTSGKTTEQPISDTGTVSTSAAQQAQTETQKLEELQKQLKFYEELFGPKEQATQTFQQPPVQPQQTPVQPQQAQPNILDAVQITENDLTDLLSGAPERAVPIIKKFIATAMYLSTQNFMQTQQMHERVQRYNDSCVNAFYEQYDDLQNYRPIVKFAGDQIQQEYMQRGIQKYPHQLIKEIGDRARDIRDKMLSGSSSPTKSQPKVTRQGEVSGTKPAPTPKGQLTEQQNDMFDLLND